MPDKKTNDFSFMPPPQPAQRIEGKPRFAYCKECGAIPPFIVCYVPDTEADDELGGNMVEVRCENVEPFAATNFYNDGTVGVTERHKQEASDSDNAFCGVCRADVDFSYRAADLAAMGPRGRY